MYILELHYEGARLNGSGRFAVAVRGGGIPRWTLLPADPCSREPLRLIALACGGAAFIGRLPCDLDRFLGPGSGDLRLEALVAPHAPRDYPREAPARRGTALELSAGGEARSLPSRSCRSLPKGIPVAAPGLDRANMPWFFLAYGPELRIEKEIGDRRPGFRFSETLENMNARQLLAVAFVQNDETKEIVQASLAK